MNFASDLFVTILKNIKTDIRLYTYKQFLPDKPRHDDVWIVEYPKSGVTWLSFLIANVNTRMSAATTEVNFFNINDFVPDIHSLRCINEASKTSFPGFRLIKSHSDYNPFYYKVIYLVRDPRSVMISYHKFLSGLQQYSGSVSSLIRDKRHGIDAWVKHVSGWINKVSIDKRIYFIRYEDLLDNTALSVSNLYQHLGLVVPGEVVKDAVNASSRERMMGLEEEWKKGDIRYSQKLKDFIFVGGTKHKASDLSATDIEYIDKSAADIMKIFGYV